MRSSFSEVVFARENFRQIDGVVMDKQFSMVSGCCMLQAAPVDEMLAAKNFCFLFLSTKHGTLFQKGRHVDITCLSLDNTM